MKKTFLFAITAILALCLCSCNDNQIGVIGGADGPTTMFVGEINRDSNIENNAATYVGEAIKHTVNAASVAADESFVESFAAGASTKEILTQIGAGDYSAPKKVYELKIDRTAAVEQLNAEEVNSQYAKLLELNKLKLISFATSCNASYGSGVLAATSALNEHEGYIMPDGFGDDFALYLVYDGDYSSFVEFSKIGENVIEAQMTFIKNGEDGVVGFIDLLKEILGDNYTFTSVTEK